MAQTKRKRRTKHRGNAAGMVEARGRTSKPAAGAPRKSTARRPGPGLKPPTWSAAGFKALFGVAILFAFFTLLNKQPAGEALVFCAFAFLLYMPIMFVTDRFIYNRKQAKAKG